MKFGYFVHYDQTQHDKSEHQVYVDSWEQIEYADEAFDYIWFPEHHFERHHISPGPLLTVIDAAHRTSHARIGAAVILSPFYHPLILAEQIGLADHLTNGRLEVAFGRGTHHYEYERLGMTEAQASGRQRECIEVLLGAWAKDEDFEYHGAYYDFPPTYTLPRPVQKPHPRIGVAGRTPETLRFVMENGLSLHTTPRQEPISRVYSTMNLIDSIVADVGAKVRPPISIQQTTYVTEDRDDALEQMKYLRQIYEDNWHFHQGSVRISKGNVEHQPMPEGMAFGLEEFIERNAVGDPDTVVKRLCTYVDIGYDEYVANLDFGQPQEKVLPSVKLFIEEVMPRVRAYAASPERAAKKAAEAAAKSNGHRPTAEIKAELLTANERQIGPGWRDWEASEWMDHFDRRRTNGDARAIYVFDYDAGPRVRADGSGAVVGGNLLLLRDDVCPICSRPVIALYRRWGPETVAEMRAHVREKLTANNWHEQHP